MVGSGNHEQPYGCLVGPTGNAVGEVTVTQTILYSALVVGISKFVRCMIVIASGVLPDWGIRTVIRVDVCHVNMTCYGIQRRDLDGCWY